MPLFYSVLLVWYNGSHRAVKGTDMAKILVVDDAEETIWLLKKILTNDGHRVETARDGAEGIRQAYAFQPDLVLLDVMMPGMDGWTTLRRLREFSNVPVIMVTAIGTEVHKVQGLDLGADDYLTKPYGMEELKARIRATLRRVAPPSPGESRPLRFDGGQLVITPSSHLVTVRGETVDLSPTEYKLLLYLARNAGQVLTYGQILERVWGPGYESSLANVKVYIYSLRRKIEAEPNRPRYILTKRGTGYYLAKI
jgi:two-component system, OmpR family, KDP operon response regulator KdpE